jgi:wyosine [tRNA(Phe)-imidazoG37] synthetase (radical SAM superfamily)
MEGDNDLTFGPVPSRRLGRSLGINNIAPKACSYSCTYCQVGPTSTREAASRSFYPPARIARLTEARVEELRRAGESIDYLTFVPDGEPTLDAGLAEAIDLIRPLGIPVAVISNASLAWRPEVSRALAAADWVSLKVDTVDESDWRRLNRPHPDLRLSVVLDGIRSFAAGYDGRLVSETMLVAGVNDDRDSVEAIAGFLADAGIESAYLSVPTRPTAVPGALPPAPEAVAEGYRSFSRRLPRVELLTAPDDDDFACRGEPRDELLAICAVHPMRERAVRTVLGRAGVPWSVVEDLVAAGLLREVTHRGERFYLRWAAGR